MKPPSGVIGEEGPEVQRVAAIDAVSGKLREITPENLYVYEYDWSPDSGSLAYIAAPPAGENNWWVAQLYTQSLASDSTAFHLRSNSHPRPAPWTADCRPPVVAGRRTNRLHRRFDERSGSHRRRYLLLLPSSGGRAEGCHLATQRFTPCGFIGRTIRRKTPWSGPRSRDGVMRRAAVDASQPGIARRNSP